MRGVLKPREDRIANDAYFTPETLADEICRRLKPITGGCDRILEPNAGSGAFIAAACRTWPSAAVHGEDIEGEYETLKPWDGEFDLILGNPPFNLAEQQVRASILRLRSVGHLAFILRLSFLAGQRRLALYEKHPLRYLIPITPRPSFTPDGKTDASEYGVFVWERGYTGHAEILPHLRWSPRQTRLLP